ncbi:hypothetical protein ABBQ32_009761 [Trebouxia sp. C0010 RCD-2024]
MVSPTLTFDSTLGGTKNWKGGMHAKEPPRPVPIYPNYAQPELCFVNLYQEDLVYRARDNITSDRWYLQPQAIKKTGTSSGSPMVLWG